MLQNTDRDRILITCILLLARYIYHNLVARSFTFLHRSTLLVDVNPHMSLQLVRKRKCFAAPRILANKWFITNMNAFQMFLHNSRSGKCLATTRECACIRSLAGMEPLMDVKVAFHRESTLAFIIITCKRFLAIVHFHMLKIPGRTDERFATIG